MLNRACEYGGAGPKSAGVDVGGCGRGPAGGGLGGGISYLASAEGRTIELMGAGMGDVERMCGCAPGDGTGEGCAESEGVAPEGLVGTESKQLVNHICDMSIEMVHSPKVLLEGVTGRVLVESAGLGILSDFSALEFTRHLIPGVGVGGVNVTGIGAAVDASSPFASVCVLTERP